MTNPFRNLSNTEKPEPPVEYEEVGGAFSCQQSGCYNVSKEARYFHTGRLLAWQCKDGHKSFIEDFSL